MITSPWPAVGESLSNLNKLFVHQAHPEESWIKPFVPLVDEFFATKVVNIFIMQKPYGWVETELNTWTFEGFGAEFEEDLAKLITNIDKFPFYRLLIWVDMATPELIRQQCPASDILQMMNKTASAVAGLANDFIKYMGKLDSIQPASYFQPFIDAAFSEA